MFDSWRITKSRGACSRCGEEFAANRVLFSGLKEEEGELTRRDFCPDCWEQDDAGFFCFWRTRRPEAEQKQTVDTDLMLEFFDRLDRPDTEKKGALRFVLALYLMRRKELKLLQVERDGGGESLVLQRRSSGGKARVANPGLTEEQIQETAAHLGHLLNADL